MSIKHLSLCMSARNLNLVLSIFSTQRQNYVSSDGEIVFSQNTRRGGEVWQQLSTQCQDVDVMLV